MRTNGRKSAANGPCCGYARPMSTDPGREQNWYPISKLGWFTSHIREGVEATSHQLELLQPARARPYLLDDATVARIIQVHHDQAEDLTLFQNQADRWKTPGLTATQRAGIAEYETLIAQLRQVNAEVLAVADELSRGTIDTVLAKSDLELGIEALMPECSRSGETTAAGLYDPAATTVRPGRHQPVKHRTPPRSITGSFPRRDRIEDHSLKRRALLRGQSK